MVFMYSGTFRYIKVVPNGIFFFFFFRRKIIGSPALRKKSFHPSFNNKKLVLEFDNRYLLGSLKATYGKVFRFRETLNWCFLQHQRARRGETFYKGTQFQEAFSIPSGFLYGDQNNFTQPVTKVQLVHKSYCFINCDNGRDFHFN